MLHRATNRNHRNTWFLDTKAEAGAAKLPQTTTTRKGRKMFYIIGTKEQTHEFIDNNRIPYFDHREDDAYTGEIKLHDEEEAKAILYINLENDSFTVQTIDSETGGVINEIDYPTYDEALTAYDAANDSEV